MQRKRGYKAGGEAARGAALRTHDEGERALGVDGDAREGVEERVAARAIGHARDTPGAGDRSDGVARVDRDLADRVAARVSLQGGNATP